MRNMSKWVLVMLAALMSAGCFQVERVVTVKPDGSGTLEEKVMFSKKIMQSFADAFQPEEGGEKAAAPDMYDEKGLKAAAQGMGKGVRYVGSSKVSDEKFTGYRVVYTFKNIDELLVDSGPPSMDKKPGKASPDQGMRFSFKAAKAGKPALLVLKSAKVKDKVNTENAESPVEPNKEANQQELDAMKGMLEGMRFSFSVVVDGKIVETNASHHDNSRIILAEVDFSRILNLTEQELARLNDLKGKDMTAIMAALKNFPGVKVDLNKELRVSFR